ncbi:iron ABC transporter substrate-binding protein [Cereibacter changlensis JA139]|uniref:Iron ABC transporter substrate-binding protein n=2 Tax=Cereibacter changlensis TaxID=402884 RepID=A0A2T4JRD8_9RHOB|nr:ATP-binding cassette domain-containing protein [Cereibacter changlensis]PTE20323.1 iron ABC transporter substrate-binding protein [Cereibacter changlensis JA139]PZX50040.1 iron complex transport system ATP-binding protein [Cereibacter changlensis]
MTLFSCTGVERHAEGRRLLGPLDLTIEPGRITGILGHNGSGKSTLLKLLARQEAPDAGAVLFQERALAQWDQRELARRLAWLPQTPAAAPGMTLRELVALGRYPWHGLLGRRGAADRAACAEAMALTGTEALADRQVDTLSGGERQRGWIAMLLAQGAEALLLDEPISALDVAHQIEVMGLLRRLNRTRGISVLMVLHDLNLASGWCDEAVALRAGRLVAHGPMAELLVPAVLQRLYGLEMDVIPHRRRTLVMPEAFFAARPDEVEG